MHASISKRGTIASASSDAYIIVIAVLQSQTLNDMKSKFLAS